MAEFNYENKDMLKHNDKIMPASFYRDKHYIEIQKKINERILNKNIHTHIYADNISNDMKQYLMDKGFIVTYSSSRCDYIISW